MTHPQYVIKFHIPHRFRKLLFGGGILLCLSQFCLSQESLKTEFIGRVIDSEGRSVKGASIYLEPDKSNGGFDQFIVASESAADGTFRMSKALSRENKKRTWRLFVVVDETGREFINPVTPPFDLLRSKNGSFEGQIIRPGANKVVDLRNIVVQHYYGAVELDVGQLIESHSDKFPWKDVDIRIFDERGILASDSSLSQNALDRSIIDTTLKMSLPEGLWNVELKLGAKVIGRARGFCVTRHRRNSVILNAARSGQ